MSKINNNIKCPHCSEEFQLEDVFKEHLDEINNQKQLNDEKAKRLEKAEKVYLQQKKAAEDANLEVKSLRGIIENFDKDKEEAIKDALKDKEDAIKQSVQENLEIENAKKISSEIDKQKKTLEEGYKQKYKKELALAQESIPISVEKDLLASKRKISQYEEQIKLLERKAKQGAVEAQGEAQEELIEDYLKRIFPNDKIVPVKKGARGADCIHIVNEKENHNIGSVIYESKDTQKFSEEWVEKLFKDMTNENISFGVIVSEAMPKDYNGGLVYRYEGRITICPMNKNYLRILAEAMRENIIRTVKIKNLNNFSDSTKDDLWNLITSDSFSMKLRRYVSFYIKEQSQIDKDKSAAMLSIKNRNKNLQDKKTSFFEIVSEISSVEGTLPENILEHDETMLLE